MQTTDLTQQYAHYHQKWVQEQAEITRLIEYVQVTQPDSYTIGWEAQNNAYWNKVHKTHLRQAKDRSRYYNKRMCALELKSQQQGNGIGSLTWWGMCQPH